MLNFANLNWIAIFGATLASFALGGLWYGPLFGKAWMAVVGKKREELPTDATPFIVSFVTALITSVVLASLIQALGVVRVIDGVVLGLITSIGFIATASASDGAFGGSGVRLVMIQAGYRVVYSAIMGAILAFWR